MKPLNVELDNYNVYYEETVEGLKIFVHRRDENHEEIIPLGYVYGSNYLHLRNTNVDTNSI